jgi:hypothetical protein
MARKLRFGPACYHVLHMIPIQVAHEMNFFYDCGLRDEDGKPDYEIVRGGAGYGYRYGRQALHFRLSAKART